MISPTFDHETAPSVAVALPAGRCLGGAQASCDLVSLGEFPDRSGLAGDVSVARCRTCGAGYSQPPLTNVAFLYSDRTSQDFQPRTGLIARTIKNLFFGVQARRLLARVGGEPRLIVDFACGSGLFTSSVAKAAPAARMVGMDFHAAPPADLTGADYLPSERGAELAGSADLVMAMHVIEHDDDPRALMARIAGLAKPGAHVVVETPNIDCFWTAWFGKAWDAWYLPYHRTHFTRATLRGLVESAGLEVVHETDVSVPTIGRTLANLLGLRNGLVFILIGAACHPVQWAAEWLSRRPVAIRVIARKP